MYSTSIVQNSSSTNFIMEKKSEKARGLEKSLCIIVLSTKTQCWRHVDFSTIIYSFSLSWIASILFSLSTPLFFQHHTVYWCVFLPKIKRRRKTTSRVINVKVVFLLLCPLPNHPSLSLPRVKRFCCCPVHIISPARTGLPCKASQGKKDVLPRKTTLSLCHSRATGFPPKFSWTFPVASPSELGDQKMKRKITFLFAEQTFGWHMFECTLTLPGQNPTPIFPKIEPDLVCKTSPHLWRHGRVTNEALGGILLRRREIGSRVQKGVQKIPFSYTTGVAPPDLSQGRKSRSWWFFSPFSWRLAETAFSTVWIWV